MSDEESMPRLTHLDEQGQARMVDVSAKTTTRREAVATGRVVMAPKTLAAWRRVMRLR
jgi:cyclic pyranopterin phosphate synthase